MEGNSEMGILASRNAPVLTRLVASIRDHRGRGGNLSMGVVHAFRAAISDGDLRPGDKLENETRLAETLDISRPTLRQALGVLIHDGVLDARRGIGTFVASPRASVESGIEQMHSASSLIRQAGRQPGTRDFALRRSKAGPDVAEALELAVGDPVFAITRTRLADAEPLIACFEFLPLAHVPYKAVKSFDGGSLYHFMATQLDLRVVECHTTILAVRPPPDVALRLRVTEDHPVLELRQIHFSSQGRRVLFARNFHNSAMTSFTAKRTVSVQDQ